MAPRKSRFQTDEPKPLRTGPQGECFTSEQLALIGSFVSAVLLDGNGAYIKGNERGDYIRLTLYIDGDKYADNLTPRDDLITVLDDYASQFKVQGYFRDIVTALRKGVGPAAAGAPETPRKRASQAESTPL